MNKSLLSCICGGDIISKILKNSEMISAIKEINCYKRVIREGNLDKGLFEEVMFEMRPEGRQLCEK